MLLSVNELNIIQLKLILYFRYFEIKEHNYYYKNNYVQVKC